MPTQPNMPNRRSFLKRSAAAATGLAVGTFGGVQPSSAASTPRVFRLWAISDAHVRTDLKHGRQSLAEAIGQSEHGSKEGGPPFEWDLALHYGDLSGNQGVPQDDEGREVVRQFAAARKHRREDLYNLVGNHDANRFGEPIQWWFRKWVDPTGENTEFSGVDPGRRRFPVQGTWERYSFRVGNLLFLVMGDRNDLAPPVGRGQSGGYPAGAVTGERSRNMRLRVGTRRPNGRSGSTSRFPFARSSEHQSLSSVRNECVDYSC